MLQPLRASIYAFKTDFVLASLDRAAEAGRTRGSASGV